MADKDTMGTDPAVSAGAPHERVGSLGLGNPMKESRSAPMIPGSVPAADDKHPGYVIGKGFNPTTDTEIARDAVRLAFEAGWQAGQEDRSSLSCEEAFKEWAGQ